MNADDRYAILIDYAEGTLPPERIPVAEALLHSSAEAREEFALLCTVFGKLQNTGSETVPEGYFSTFPSRLRARIASGARPSFLLPGFLASLARPAFVAAGLFILVAAYRTFDPAGGYTPVHDVVAGIAQEEFPELFEDQTLFASSMEEIAATVHIDAEAFGADASQLQSESDLNSLGEQELSTLVERLESRGH